MTALTFPSSPESGDTYSAPNGILYTYDGVKWVATTTTITSETVTDFIRDNSATMIMDGTHNGVLVSYDSQLNELNLTIEIDGGTAATTY